MFFVISLLTALIFYTVKGVYVMSELSTELFQIKKRLMLRMMKIPSIPETLHQAVMDSLQYKLAMACARLKRDYALPELQWNQRGTAAGTAWPLRNEIRLNPVLFMENQQAFIDEVIPHELAHLLVWHYFGRVAPHGKEWKWMMETVLEVPARRTHRFATDSLARKTFAYHCACQSHQLTVRRHYRVLRGEAEYRCRNCGTQLQETIA